MFSLPSFEQRYDHNNAKNGKYKIFFIILNLNPFSAVKRIIIYLLQLLIQLTVSFKYFD